MSIGYPDRSVERKVMSTHRSGEPVDQLQPVVTTDEVLAAQSLVRQVTFEDSLVGYLLDIVEATRAHPGFRVGVSTRGALSFYRGCQARALSDRRDFVTPDDIKSLAVATLAHRVLPEGVFHSAGRETVESELKELLDQVPVPV